MYVQKYIICYGSLYIQVWVYVLLVHCVPVCMSVHILLYTRTHTCVYASVLLCAYRTKCSCLRVSAFVHVCLCGLATLLPVQ